MDKTIYIYYNIKESMKNTYRIEIRHYDSYTGGGARVYENERLVKGVSAGGCGYDRNGKAFGNWLSTLPEFMEGIKHIKAHYGSGDKGGGLYGLRHYNKVTNKLQKRSSANSRSYVDGACGFDSIRRILEHMGGSVEYVGGNKSSNFYKVTTKQGGRV